jgi:hypothetical protein
MSKRYIYPPFGYKWNDDKVLESNDVQGVKKTAIGMSDDPEWQYAMRHATHRERLEMFKQNGFQFEKEKYLEE